MNLYCTTPAAATLVLILSLCLMPGALCAAQTGNVPDLIREAVNRSFPNASITSVEPETFKGRQVSEVKLITDAGVEYELLIAESGEVLSQHKTNTPPLIGGELMIGLGVRIETSIYKEVDASVTPAPIIRYENGPLEIGTTDGVFAKFRFFKTQGFSISLGGYLDLNQGYDPSDSDYLKGMDELDTLYGASLELEWRYKDLGAALELSQDISGEHEGQQVELSFYYELAAGGFTLEPEISLTWMSSGTVDYFYGVSASEALPNRPRYSPGAGYEVEMQIKIMRPIYGGLSALASFAVSAYGSQITDSPLVDEEYQAGAVLGLVYRF